MKALGRRILRIEAREQPREVEQGPSHLIVLPDAWSEEACRTYDALVASDDFAAWADLLEQHTGQRRDRKHGSSRCGGGRRTTRTCR